MIERPWIYWTQVEEIQKVTNALVIASHQHNVVAKVKTRKYSNAPFITHPIRLSLAVSTHPDAKLSWVCAALLHDTIEDTVDSEEEVFALKHKIMTDCGEDVLILVEELTNQKHDKSLKREQKKELDLLRLKDVSKPAKILKMLDRIDNLRDMVGAPVSFKKIYVRESENLLNAIGNADKNISCQLHSAILDIYAWRQFSQWELEQKPLGTAFEHAKNGYCFVEEAGIGGYLRYKDFSQKFTVQSRNLMRETGGSVRSIQELF